MSAEQHTSLTGLWMGRYQYATGGSPVAFEVRMIETAGALSGEVTEPNSFKEGMGASLSSVIDGARAGDQVNFVKTYHGFDAENHPMYQGTSNAALTRIDGAWQFVDARMGRGSFSMVRVNPVAAATARKSVQEVEI